MEVNSQNLKKNNFNVEQTFLTPFRSHVNNNEHGGNNNSMEDKKPVPFL